MLIVLYTLSLLGCSPVETKTSLILTIEGSDLQSVADASDTLILIIDPQTPFLNSIGEPLLDGDSQGGFTATNALTGDDELELVWERGFDSAALPTIELALGTNNQDLSFQAWGTSEAQGRVAESDLVGPISFITDQVVLVTVSGLAVLETPINDCSDETDNDGDGWIDAGDPDCASGIEELGLGSDACNDGQDNDSDGAVDADDPECDSAQDDQEASGCTDGQDNDGDGWTDADDPECDTGSDEEGVRISRECNDGVDNDSDGAIDAEDSD
ncbi:MAG: hypothetical protein ACI9VR_004078, partial [Cognaticolwellia sp.]